MDLLFSGRALDGMKRDGRTLAHNTLEEMREMAVQRMKEGERPAEVAASFGMHRSWAFKCRALARGRGKGVRVLRATKGTGRPRTMSPRQDAPVFRWINGKNPRQYGIDFGRWTRQIVQVLVRQRFGVALSLASVGPLLARLGLTAQKPLQRAYQRDPEAVALWRHETIPALAQLACEQGADISFWDESGVRADTVQGKTWGVCGPTPVVNRRGPRQGISAASAVNSKGAFWFATYQGGLSGDLFVELLTKRMPRRKKAVQMVVDGLPAHKKALVNHYIAATNGKFNLHFLPGDAPDLNPGELVWSH